MLAKGSHPWVFRAEKSFIAIAWLMGVSIIAQGAVHLGEAIAFMHDQPIMYR